MAIEFPKIFQSSLRLLVNIIKLDNHEDRILLKENSIINLLKVLHKLIFNKEENV